ncbi:oxidoreductase [Micromonospora sp. ATCC 39149]|uniref:Gfo/Idh/MocA family oxidoreductase n=1 Tax=Micromonospora carbonacea TaxID=47853 RepID=A0A7D6CH43_9ACTN|nr:Gfo/Idh/MocA family oxidoreductase [Micromonospora sp. ATCC 39149]EEP75107.1 oxidoreductase [Micromonospora sp. ATCC 39149]QLK01396.1 Gfo/Idh/MocA family oxidoreductase [Micromonospora carbonacea]
MRACRVGLVGAGGVAQRHARVLGGFSDVEILGVTDVTRDAAAHLADAHGARTFVDVAELLAAGPDAVYVCVPPFAHGPVEEAVIAAGVPMFVEKPVAVDLDTAERVADLVARRGLLTGVGHHWRYLHVVEQARELLADRPVRMVSGAWLDKVPPVAWWARRDRSGGPVVEQAAHVLDLMRALVGEVAEVTAYGDGAPPPVEGADIDSVTTAALRFADGAVGTLAAACVLGWKHRAGLEILADGLALSLGEDGLTVRDGDGERHLPADPDGARTAVDRAFVDAVRGVGDDVRVPYAEALRTQRLALAVAESARTGRPVSLPTGLAATLRVAAAPAPVGVGPDA